MTRSYGSHIVEGSIPSQRAGASVTFDTFHEKTLTYSTTVNSNIQLMIGGLMVSKHRSRLLQTEKLPHQSRIENPQIVGIRKCR